MGSAAHTGASMVEGHAYAVSLPWGGKKGFLGGSGCGDACVAGCVCVCGGGGAKGCLCGVGWGGGGTYYACGDIIPVNCVSSASPAGVGPSCNGAPGTGGALMVRQHNNADGQSPHGAASWQARPSRPTRDVDAQDDHPADNADGPNLPIPRDLDANGAPQRHNLNWLFQQFLQRNVVVEGLPGAGKTHSLRDIVSRYCQACGGRTKIAHGAIRGLVSLLSGGETLAALWDLAANWPGQKRAPLSAKVQRARGWTAFALDEYGEVSGPLFEVGLCPSCGCNCILAVLLQQ